MDVRPSEGVAKGCYYYTSTYANQSLCLTIKADPADAKTCYYNTWSAAEQAECLKSGKR